MSVIYRPDTSWTDVIFTARGFQQVAAGAGFVDVGWLGAWTRRDVAGVDVLRYIDAASNPDGNVACIGVGGNDYAYLVTAAGVSTARTSAVTVVSLGPVYQPPPMPGSRQQAYAQNCVGLYWDAGGWVPVVQRTATTYTVGLQTRTFPFPDGTSQGFRDVQPNGAIVFGDDAHLVTIAGVTLHKPMTRGGLTVGQINGPDRIDGVYGFGKHFSAIPGQAFEPKVAWDLADRWAIVARTGLGAASTVVPPYGAVPVEPPPIVIPPIVVPPIHPPIDPPEVPPVFRYDLSPLHAYAQRRWAELPHTSRHEQAAALYRILHEFRALGHPMIEVYRKGRTDTTFHGSDGFDYAEDILVIVQADGKWWSDVGGAFGSDAAHLSFNGNSFQLTDQPQNCYPPPVPEGELEPPVVPPDKPPVVTPPVTPPVTGLEGRVAQLEREGVLDRRTLSGVIDQADQTDATAEALDTRVGDLEKAPPGGGALPADVVRESTHEGRIFGQPVKLQKKPPKRDGTP